LTGAIVKSSLAPIERMKVLFETQTMLTGHQKLQYTGIVTSFIKVWKRDGFLAFWKGNGVNLLRIVPDSAIKFTSFDMYKRLVPKLFPKFYETPAGYFTSSFISGCLSGASQVVLTYPLDVVKTRIMIGGGLYNGLIHCYTDTLHTEGVKAFYKGIIPTLLSVTFYVGVSLGLYDAMKTQFLSPNSSTLLLLTVGAAGSMVAGCITFPFDIVRRRLQLQGSLHHREELYKGAWHCAKTLFQNEGFFGLYRGFVLQMMRSAPATAMQFVTYDFMKKVIGVRDRPPR